MRQFDTVLFDLDGTLLYTLPDIHASVNAALEAFSYPLNTLEDTRAAVGYGSRWLIQQSLPVGSSPETVDRVLAFYRQYYNEHLVVETVPYPGIEDTLHALKAMGVRMGVATNKFHESAVKMRARFFPDTIEHTEGNIQDRPAKPAPDAALAAMEALGGTAERTLFVGDSDPDARTAANAGMACVLCAWGYRTYGELESCGPLAVIRRPEELLKYI